MNLQRLPSYLCQAVDAKSCLKTVICLCRKPLQFPLFEEHSFTIKCPCPSCSQENTRKAEKKEEVWSFLQCLYTGSLRCNKAVPGIRLD